MSTRSGFLHTLLPIHVTIMLNKAANGVNLGRQHSRHLISSCRFF